jgi:hypothetical protein
MSAQATLDNCPTREVPPPLKLAIYGFFRYLLFAALPFNSTKIASKG